jgi:orotidine-5'-phosphate decarboxylase
MSLSFADRLIDQIRTKRSIICVGLDPRLDGSDAIPAFLQEKSKHDANETIWAFNKAIIEATIPYAPVFKPQSAFYEQYDAYEALKKTIRFVHDMGALVILDAKRNDIGSTATAYAKAAFDRLEVDAITVNGYLGIDGVKPFLEYIPKGKGLFLLLKTSNKSSGDFQDLFAYSSPDINPVLTSTEKFPGIAVRNYIIMSRLMVKWSQDATLCGTSKIYGKEGYSSVGGVVGATYAEQVVAIRSEAPKNFLLIPGYGAQGGTAQDIVKGVNSDGLGAIVNASRSINFAYQTKPYSETYSADQFARAATAAVKDMQNEINNALSTVQKLAYKPR